MAKTHQQNNLCEKNVIDLFIFEGLDLHRYFWKTENTNKDGGGSLEGKISTNLKASQLHRTWFKLSNMDTSG